MSKIQKLHKILALVIIAAVTITVSINGIATNGKGAASAYEGQAITGAAPTLIELIAARTAESTEKAMQTAAVQQEDKPTADFSAEETGMLLKIAMAEAEGESTEGKALVILVVLNRAKAPEFPGTIQEVIFQRHQFTPVMNGRYEAAQPDEDCRKALDMVLNGWDESNGALYFESCKNSDNWHSRNLEFLFRYGNHNFYR